MKKKLPLIIVILVLLGFGAAYVVIPKTYSIYQEAMQLAENNEQVTALLGENIRDGLFAYSKISHGNATLEIPVHGDRSDGELLVYGHKQDNVWILKNVYFQAPQLEKRVVVFGN